MRAILSFVHRLVLAARGVVSIWLFFSVLLVSFTLMLLQLLNNVDNNLYPAAWNGLVANVWQTGYLLLPFLAIAILGIRRFETLVIRKFLNSLNKEEKKILAEFLQLERVIGVPLSYQSEDVQSLIHKGIISKGSGIKFPPNEINPHRYSYYSMPTWINDFIKSNPELLDENQGPPLPKD